MTYIDTLGKVREKIQEMSTYNWDEVVSVGDMAFEGLESMRIAEKKVAVLPTAQRLLANRLRVPYSYLTRCPPELQARNLNYWLSQEVQKRDSLFCRFRGNSLRAVFTDRYTAIDHTEVLAQMAENGFDDDSEVHYNFDDSLLVLKIPDYTRKFDLQKSEIVPGVSVANSEVGVLALSIEAYFYRLVCSNGLISKTGISSKFKHISRNTLKKFSDSLEHVVRESQNGQIQFQLSLQYPVDDPLAKIESLASQYKLTKRETQVVQEAWDVEQGYNLFYVANAFTRGAQEKDLSAEESYRLERVAGTVLEEARTNSFM